MNVSLMFIFSGNFQFETGLFSLVGERDVVVHICNQGLILKARMKPRHLNNHLGYIVLNPEIHNFLQELCS